MSFSSSDDVTLGALIGRGGTATVHVARRNDETLAVKKFNYPSARTLQAFKRELTILTSVQHRNIVQLRDFSEAQSSLMLITELCEGGCMFDLLHSTNMEVLTSQKCAMLADVARAMHHLHGLAPRIIHRDLKSLNLLIAAKFSPEHEAPCVKLCDFGSAHVSEIESCKAGDKPNSLTKNVGTPHWMAPEVALGKYDEKVDVYSFAMVMFELFALLLPFADLDASEVHLASSQGLRPDLDELDPETPSDLVDLMVKCWASAPADRPSFEHICSLLLRENFYIPNEGILPDRMTL